MAISATADYRTRGGNKVRIYATDGESESPVHGAYQSTIGWIPVAWTKNGVYLDGKETGLDLIENE